MSIPKVFISYSHDSLEHKKWVNELGTRLRNNGIDAILDQWELLPGDDLPYFMETHLANADKILMVCTENYVSKANEGKGGVGYEKMVITSNLLKSIDENKVIPIVRQTASSIIPTFLKSKYYLNFSNNKDFEFGFDELIRTIHQSPLLKKPEIGNNPFSGNAENYSTQKHNDSLLELMTAIVEKYENQKDDLVNMNSLRAKLDISRIYFDLLIDSAVSQGLIRLASSNYIALDKSGKIYAVENGLIS